MADGGSKRKAGDADLDEPTATEVYAKFDATVRARLDSLFASGLVRAEELDARALEGLAQFPPKYAVEIIEQYERSGLRNVRNKAAYLSGVITRFRTKEYAHLHPDLQYWLTQLYSTPGKLKHNDLDSRCLEALEALPLPTAIRFLERFFARDFSEVRSPAAVFMASLRQLEPAAPPASSRYPSSAPPPAYHARAVVPASYRSPSRYDDEAYDTQYPSTSRYKPGAVPVGGLNPILEGRHSYGSEQHMLGVRTDEFHNLSIFSPFVHPASALKLQQLWDQGVRLVSLLDDRAWEALADLAAPEALAVIDAVAEGLRSGKLRNPNAFFMSVARQYLDAVRPPDLPSAPIPMYRVSGRVAAPMARERDVADRWDGGSERRDDPRHAGSAERRPSVPGDLDMLPPRLKDKILEVVGIHKRHLRETHFDEGVVESLRRLSEKDALVALDEVASTDMATVRNIPAYMMGIAKRYKRT